VYESALIDVPPRSSASTELAVREERIDDSAWDAYVDGHAAASIYHASAWRRVIEATFRKHVHRLVVRGPEGRIRGVLPLVRLHGWFLPDMLVSLPYCSFGGPLADDPPAADALMSAAAALADNLGCDVTEIRCGMSALVDTNAWSRREDKVQMVLQLPESADALGRALGSKLRSQIKRPLKDGADVRIGGGELVPSFYEIFSKKMRDLGTPVYPRAFFDNVAAQLGDHVRVLVIGIAGSPAAAALLIRYRDTFEVPWAASDRKYDRISVNMLLYWEALRSSIESGAQYFDFGRSTRGGTTHRFKRQWGAEERSLQWLYRAPRERRLAGTAAGGGSQALADLWKRLPLPVANWLGPKITADLPW
jgi:serine/alanine adding enzyme